MSAQLVELFLNDLVNLGDLQHNHVASEETLRFMLYAFNSMYNIKADLVHRDHIESHIDKLVAQYKPSQGPSRFQILFETGARSRVRQNDKGNIHYAGLDLLLLPNGTKKAFFADYLNGDTVSITPLMNSIKKYNILLLKAGGLDKDGKKIIMQADDYHCPIFSIDFLLKIFSQDIYAAIEKFTDENNVVRWFDLEPALVWNSQSVSFLFKYVDHLQEKRKSPKKEDPALTTQEDIHGNTFSKFLALGLVKNLDQSSKYYEKIQNNSIKQTALLLCYKAWSYFLKQQLTGGNLLFIFYKPHPEIYELLKNKKASCLLPFIFYNIGFWNVCLSNKQFKNLFGSEKFIDLLHLNIININDLLKLIAPFYVTDPKIVASDKNTSLNSNVINVLIKNIPLIDILIKNYQLMAEGNKPPLLKLLSQTSTNALLSNHTIGKLVSEYPLDIRRLLEIPFAKINLYHLNSLADEEKVTYLKSLNEPIPLRRTPNASPSRVLKKKVFRRESSSEDEGNIFSSLLFNVPDAESVENYPLRQNIQATPNENVSSRAVSQAQALAQSMSNIFENRDSTENKNTDEKPHTTLTF